MYQAAASHSSCSGVRIVYQAAASHSLCSGVRIVYQAAASHSLCSGVRIVYQAAAKKLNGSSVQSGPGYLGSKSACGALSHPSRSDGCGECHPLECWFPSMLSRGAKCIC